MTDTLFDPDVYGPGRKKAEPKARTTLEQRSAGVEPHQEPWCLIRHREGLHPYFHLISATTDSAAVLALCGARGTKVHNDGVTQMVRCPTCQVSMELMLAP